jgi:hypothetical protein
MRRLFAGFVALLVLAGCDGGGGGGALLGPDASEREPSGRTTPFRGLGTWVDVYDYVPGFQPEGSVPDVTPQSTRDMRRLGIETLYLQAAQDDARSPGDTVDPALLGQFLRAAHRAGLDVVAWYLPRFGDVAADLRRVQALLDFEAGDERFDGLALDIEWTGTVPDAAARNAALIDLSNQVREAAGDRAVGAVVLDPVHLEVVNQAYWADFPWRDLAELYDVWLPMTYWTNREESSGYRDGFAYTDENLRRLRRNLGDDDAPVHPIGGIGDTAESHDYDGFVRAAREHAAIGWSIYDFDVTASSAWPRLRG